MCRTWSVDQSRSQTENLRSIGASPGGRGGPGGFVVCWQLEGWEGRELGIIDEFVISGPTVQVTVRFTAWGTAES